MFGLRKVFIPVCSLGDILQPAGGGREGRRSGEPSLDLGGNWRGLVCLGWPEDINMYLIYGDCLAVNVDSELMMLEEAHLSVLRGEMLVVL